MVVVGTSRAGKIEALPGEHGFVNLNLPGTGPETLAPLVRRLHAMGHGRLTVYLSVESFWFGRGWRTQTFFTRSYLRNAKYLLSTQTLHATLEELRRAPGAIRHPRALRPWAIYRDHGVCVVSRGNTVLAGAGNVWAPDGGLWYNEEVTGAARPHGQPIASLEHGGFVGTKLDPRRRAVLDPALRTASSYGWRVVGVALPYSTYWRRRLERDPQSRGVVTAFRHELSGIFARHGFRFLDLTDVRSVPCGEHSFSRYDGGHPDLACARRIRRLLDAAAARGYWMYSSAVRSSAAGRAAAPRRRPAGTGSIPDPAAIPSRTRTTRSRRFASRTLASQSGNAAVRRNLTRKSVSGG